jgi:hypothetical protein
MHGSDMRADVTQKRRRDPQSPGGAQRGAGHARALSSANPSAAPYRPENGVGGHLRLDPHPHAMVLTRRSLGFRCLTACPPSMAPAVACPALRAPTARATRAHPTRWAGRPLVGRVLAVGADVGRTLRRTSLRASRRRGPENDARGGVFPGAARAVDQAQIAPAGHTDLEDGAPTRKFSLARRGLEGAAFGRRPSPRRALRQEISAEPRAGEEAP